MNKLVIEWSRLDCFIHSNNAFLSFYLKKYYNYAGKYEKLLFLANMQIISLNMHDTKMAQAKLNSTGKNWSRNNSETAGT